jgi:glycerol kinase
VLWDRTTGEPLHRAIVWQCRRTAALCESLAPHAPLVRAKTGLPLDAYFSGTKVRWLLDHLEIADPSNVAFGTIDTWLIWKLTGGHVHATDATNASRTLLFDIHAMQWSDELAALLGVPTSILPEVKRSIDDYGVVVGIPEVEGVAIAGVAGDQQAALFGQTCFDPGETKNTYGTGCFPMRNTGARAVESHHGLLTTVAVARDGGPGYALEGSVFIGGAAIQWLRDELRILDHASESEAAARAVEDNGGVYLVPAFVGLGAPHWDMEARGALVGLTRGSSRNHVIRAALESMAYQSRDVIEVMERESGVTSDEIWVDGGATANDFLMQFQADVLGKRVLRPEVIESTSLGAAYLAGLGVGVWKDTDELRALKRTEREFSPRVDSAERSRWTLGWERALRQARTR